MNPNHGNGIHECNPNFPWLSQNPPPLINYSQNQPFQYMNNNQNPTFPTSSNNPLPFPPFYVLESTPYQPYQPQNPLGVPFSFQTPPSYLAVNPILFPGTSVPKIQVLGIIESGDTGSENDVKELYIGTYPSAANDPYYSIRKKLISPFFPYIEVIGSWPDEEVQDDGGEASGVGMRRSRKKKHILPYITWNSASTSNFPDPEPPIPKRNKNLKFLLKKELRGSDVNYFKRIILPKHEAENHLPTLNDKKGVEILVRDVLLPVTWRMKFRFWYNNRSRIYVLEHAGDFVKKHELKCDDAIALYEDDTKHLYIYAKKNQLSDSTSKPQVITTEGINNPFPNPIEDLENNRLNAGEQSSAQGSTNFHDISYYFNRIEELLYEDEYGTPISTNDMGLNAGESSLHQEGFMNFNAIGDSVFDEHYGIPTNYGSINAGEITNQVDVSSYFNEQPESTVFDEYGIPRVDLWPQNQDNWTFK